MSNKLYGGVKANQTSVSIAVVLRATADNTELTGKVAADVNASYWRQGGVRVAITESDLASVNAAYSSGGWKEVDATNMPGVYRFDVPDAAFATGADWVVVTIKVAGAFEYIERFDLTDRISGYRSGVGASIPFRLVQSSDHLTPKTGASPAVNVLSNDNGYSPTATTNAATELGAGWYEVTLTDAELSAAASLPYVILAVTATGADPKGVVVVVEP